MKPSPFHSRRVMPLIGVLMLAAAAMVTAPTVAAGPGARPAAFAGTASFTYTGAPETWTVPADVTSIVVTVCGASGKSQALGGSGVKFAGRPGHGGCVTANVLVAPGDVVNVRVGGYPRNSGLSDVGWPDGGVMTCPGVDCGGGGGGSSDLRIGGDTLTDRVVVGGGGGGGGAGPLGGAGGNGGGGTGTIDGFGQNGGAGTGMTAPGLVVMGGGGGAFAQEFNAGCGMTGTAGVTPDCVRMEHPEWAIPPGVAGIANAGGASAIASGAIGGAGGGGYFGGGSGCSQNSGTGSFESLGTCGGGGGSAYDDPTRTDNVVYSQGPTQWYLDWLAGITTAGDDGSVTIRWPGPAVVITTTIPTTTTIAPATTAPATSTTAAIGLPSVGQSGRSVPLAVALFAVGVGLLLLARRPA